MLSLGASIGLPPAAPPPGSCSSSPGSPCTWAARKRTWPSPSQAGRKKVNKHAATGWPTASQPSGHLCPEPSPATHPGRPRLPWKTPPSPLCSAPLRMAFIKRPLPSLGAQPFRQAGLSLPEWGRGGGGGEGCGHTGPNTVVVSAGVHRPLQGSRAWSLAQHSHCNSLDCP